eukprot:CAMPEP_0197449498 /NCGR_PEP_ID=MMETSP1175-20131217/21799_1 /TAXON_ID=1003142 /ORGANISM="Triceratium dubium, Strain CCMP147" /LENGTH=410 /DNA_ID=CAMNT_0042981649 /DNA_START=99 /DNA_END=1331 /DNA_ORIENTATION=+
MPPSATKRNSNAVDASTHRNAKALKSTNAKWEVTGSAKAPLLMWYQQDDCKNKIAGFDLDHTLIKPKSGAKFPKNRSDWEYMGPANVIKMKLCKLHDEGYSIVAFTNQAGIEKKKQKASDIQGKIEDLERDLGIPVHALVACANDQYRKPATSMWKLLETKYGGNLDRSESFYCGDAAGRPKGWKNGAPRDFSSGDRSFALNLGVRFYLPEELFFEEDCSEIPFVLDGVDPKTFLEKKSKSTNTVSVPSKQEMVVFVGWPASGKSSLYRNHFAPVGYAHINRDTMGTKEKCLKEAKRALESGKSVAIDNTNPSTKDRKPYVDLAMAMEVPVRCIRMGTSRDVAVHNNYYRVKETDGAVRRIPAVAYNMFNKNLEEPTVAEGFDSVEVVPFVPNFADEDKRQLYLERVEKA